MMFDLLSEWLSITKEKPKKQENVSEFFKFVIKRMDEELAKAKLEIRKAARTKNYDFRILHRKDITDGIKKFFIDSFAVAVMVKNNDSTTSYLKWFDEWTKQLISLWLKK
jgi:hypothetical protein